MKRQAGGRYVERIEKSKKMGLREKEKTRKTKRKGEGKKVGGIK